MPISGKALALGGCVVLAACAAPGPVTPLGSSHNAVEIDTADGHVPCGGKKQHLWAWAWAGANAEHVETIDHHRDPQKKRWSRLRDLSGNGRDFYNDDGTGPAFQFGYEWYCDDCPDCTKPQDGKSMCESARVQSYETPLPVIGVHAYRPMLERFAHLRNYRQKSYNFFENIAYQDEAMNATGGFYLVFAGMHGRGKGYREIFGSDRYYNTAMQQGTAEVFITIAGEKLKLTDNGAFARGPIIMELMRDDLGAIRVWVNGVNVTRADGPTVNTAPFKVSGLAFKGGGGYSHWDDGAFEYIMCDGVPNTASREQTRKYLNEKWRIF